MTSRILFACVAVLMFVAVGCAGDGGLSTPKEMSKTMIRRITTRKSIAVASVLALGVVMTVLALAFTNRTGPNLPEPLPPMTLTYEVYGPSVGVGSRSIPAFKETRRLDYRSQTDWTETIITSPTLDLGTYGTGTYQGSYTTLNGNTITEYDALTDTTDTRSVGAGIHLPFDALGHAYTPAGTAPIVGMDAGVSVALDARVSVSGAPIQNARGVKYTKGDREIVMIEGNGFVLPVKTGTFVLKSADIGP